MHLWQRTFSLEPAEAKDAVFQTLSSDWHWGARWPNGLQKEASPHNFIMYFRILTCNHETTISVLHAGTIGAILFITSTLCMLGNKIYGLLWSTSPKAAETCTAANCLALPLIPTFCPKGQQEAVCCNLLHHITWFLAFVWWEILTLAVYRPSSERDVHQNPADSGSLEKWTFSHATPTYM